jgi:pyruvate/2-oxoglutarate dehydrogenase complex dihydrolipoamide acyltransferase (E2) component
MQIEIRVPKMGMDTTEVQVSKWLVALGDTVAAGTPIVEVETEKVTFAVESETAGTITNIIPPEGGTVAVGGLLCVMQSTES